VNHEAKVAVHRLHKFLDVEKRHTLLGDFVVSVNLPIHTAHGAVGNIDAPRHNHSTHEHNALGIVLQINLLWMELDQQLLGKELFYLG
jgi:hypothetical protein